MNNIIALNSEAYSSILIIVKYVVKRLLNVEFKTICLYISLSIAIDM